MKNQKKWLPPKRIEHEPPLSKDKITTTYAMNGLVVPLILLPLLAEINIKKSNQAKIFKKINTIIPKKTIFFNINHILRWLLPNDDLSGLSLPFLFIPKCGRTQIDSTK
jgi:hypothetical protein